MLAEEAAKAAAAAAEKAEADAAKKALKLPDSAAPVEDDEAPSPAFEPPPTPRYKGKDFLRQAHDMDLSIDLSAVRAALKPDGPGLRDPALAFPHLRRRERFVAWEHTAEAANKEGRVFLTIPEYMAQNAAKGV